MAEDSGKGGARDCQLWAAHLQVGAQGCHPSHSKECMCEGQSVIGGFIMCSSSGSRFQQAWCTKATVLRRQHTHTWHAAATKEGAMR
eukprot:6258029-Amphidinium_carterae.2